MWLATESECYGEKWRDLNTLGEVLLLSPTMRPAGEGGLSRHRADKAELLVTRTHNLREEDTTHHAGPHSGAE